MELIRRDLELIVLNDTWILMNYYFLFFIFFDQ